MIPKFSSSVLILALAVGSQCNVDAFSVQHSRVASASASASAFVSVSTSSSSSALYATQEKTVLKAPSDIPSDDIPALFDKYVQKTYG